MEVKLIAQTNDPVEVMWTAARTCYNSKSPIEMWENLGFKISQKAIEHKDDDERVLIDELRKDTDKRWNLVTKVLDSGHGSVGEHVYFTFAIEGISRACSHQLVRHRAGIVFSQQSQRYVEIKEDLNRLKDILLILTPDSDYNLEDMGRAEAEVIPILNKYFVAVDDTNIYAYLQSLINYLSAINMGTKAEDARNFLPNATKTNITMSVNLRELIHLCNLRLCTRAQKEIRELFKLIKAEVINVQPRLAKYLVPTCEINGICYEHQCCGRKPHIDEVMAVYNAFKDDYISKEDYAQIQDSIKNPKVNEKLKALMEMPNVIEE